MYIVATFYRYSTIQTPEQMQKRYLDFCKSIDLKGLIIVAREGINGGVAGTEQQLVRFKEFLEVDFNDMSYRELHSSYNPYKKMKVKLKNEIVGFGHNPDMKNVGTYLEPSEVEALKDRADVIFIDARNDYESKIGKFNNAIIPPIETFREFPQFVNMIEEHKDKKIVLYCTGGIRCEKASAFMKERGFSDVNHIKGGIINYVQQYPDSMYDGRLFVFDDRLSVATGKNDASLKCVHCHAMTDGYENCENKTCDAFFSACGDCMTSFNATCSKTCSAELQASSVRENPLKQRS